MSKHLLGNESFTQDFIEVTIEVLFTMTGLDVESSGFYEIEGHSQGLDVTSCMDITGILGFSGGRRGSVLLTFKEETALKAVGGMLGMEFKEIDYYVRDGVGELVNMIAGGAKAKLQPKGLDFELSIPNTISGPAHKLSAPDSAVRTRLDFTSPAGIFFAEIYLQEAVLLPL